MAAVAELTATASLTWEYFLKSSSNLKHLGPVPHQPERRVSSISFNSSLKNRGAPKIKNLVLFIGFII